jgi:hypothetical protein
VIVHFMRSSVSLDPRKNKGRRHNARVAGGCPPRLDLVMRRL